MRTVPDDACGSSKRRVRCAESVRAVETADACGEDGRRLFRHIPAGEREWKRHLECKDFATDQRNSRLLIFVPFFGADHPAGRKQAILEKEERQSVRL